MNLLLKNQETEFAPYKQTLVRAGEQFDRLVVLGADLANSTEIDGFMQRFPERFFNIGSAEQNLIDIAVGLAFEGEIPFVHSFGVFVTRRPYEQVCVQVALHQANVKLVGVIPGLTSRLGPTHQAIDDIGLMRMLPHMTVIDPADATEIEQLVPIVAQHEGPIYTRMMRREVARIFDPKTYQFRIGAGVPVRNGSDVGIVTAGLMLETVLAATEILEQRGIEVAVLHMPTIKPIDADAVCELASSVSHLLSVENHLVSGGLGTAVAEVLCTHCPKRLHRMGLQDQFGAPGTPDYLFDRYQLSRDHIVSRVEQILG